MIWLFLAAALLLFSGTPATAHRLDEYLQGAILSVTKDRLEADLTLTPGVAVFPFLIPEIDTNGDGTISETEQREYASRVLNDLTLRIDGHRLMPRLASAVFPSIGEMKEGRGEIRLGFHADLPRGGASRKLVFENHHLDRISVYQVNVLVPRDPDIRIVGQNRNYTQSHYELEFDQPAPPAKSPAMALLASMPGQLGILAAIAVMALLLRSRQPAAFPQAR